MSGLRRAARVVLTDANITSLIWLAVLLFIAAEISGVVMVVKSL
ncbi:MAG: hypothetical protein JWO46_2445 [Nocardioidaceae bacterium]|nr:hypothetical protein [Nocardioidaceae bacterium]